MAVNGQRGLFCIVLRTYIPLTTYFLRLCGLFLLFWISFVRVDGSIKLGAPATFDVFTLST